MIRLTYLRHPSIALSVGIPELLVYTYWGEGGNSLNSKWLHCKASAYTGHNIKIPRIYIRANKRIRTHNHSIRKVQALIAYF
jgi:hypothetical protein